MPVKTDKDKAIVRHEPPQSIDAEQAVLGSILKDAESISAVIEYLDSYEYFYAKKHQSIFQAMLRLYEKGEPCDITTVADELSKLDQLDKIGGR